MNTTILMNQLRIYLIFKYQNIIQVYFDNVVIKLMYLTNV